MGNTCEKWIFSSIPAIEECMFNSTLERFYNLGISGLVKENIQNALDAKLPESNNPVVVTIRTGEVSDSVIPGLNDIRNRINSLEGKNEYTKETIAHMIKKMVEKKVSYISFEDSNTKGLTGAKNGQRGRKEDTWGIYAYNKGFHSIDTNSSLEEARGGSHGIGKIASNAASGLHMMYFANCDAEGNQHIGGTVQLIEHRYNGKCYRSTGYFSDIKNDKYYPFENNYDEIFSKNTRGLKIIIPFVRQEFIDEREIIKCISSDFFLAIENKKLEVNINEHNINAENISTYIKSIDYFEQEYSEIKKEFTPIYYDTYKNIEPIEIIVSNKSDTYEFNLYFNYNEEIKKARVGIIRTLGMKIEDKKIRGNINKPFNAVLIPKTSKEDVFLKGLENESHTAISHEHIRDTKLQKRAKKFITMLEKEIIKILEEEIKKSNPTDGVIDTSEMIYTVESQFKREIQKNKSTVVVNIDDKSTNKNLVKSGISTEEIQIKKGKNKSDDYQEDESGLDKGIGSEIRSEKQESEDKKSSTKKTKTKRQPRKVTPKEEVDEIDTIRGEKFSTHPDIVERVIVGSREVIKIDFRECEEIKNKNKCDIVFAVIDGMGNEYGNEFRVSSNYLSAKDMNTDGTCDLSDNKIKNVSIKDGIVKINLKLKNSFNKALKFIYYVEV
ncbi:MAG: hypothetical protein RSC49_04060 [Clostridium sp.]